MTVGDTISAVGAAGAAVTYTPAAGVETMITWVSDRTDGHQINNGTDATQVVLYSNVNVISGSLKLFVKNSVYLVIQGTSAQSKGYTGIQTK